MATYIETLKKQNGDQIAPRTVAKAVTLENGQTVESAIANDVVRKAELDAKLDRIEPNNADTYIYAVGPTSQTSFMLTTPPFPNCIPQYDNQARLSTDPPVDYSHAANKGYVDDIFSRVAKGAAGTVYTNASGVAKTIPVGQNSPDANSIVQRTGDGCVKVAEPVAGTDATPKSYVDTNFVKSLGLPTEPSIRVYAPMEGMDAYSFVTSLPTAYSIARRDGTGNIEVTTPTSENHAANKQYVDGMLYEYERDIPYYFDAMTFNPSIGLDRVYNGMVLDISNIVLSAYVIDDITGNETYFIHDITRPIQGVEDGATVSFELGGVSPSTASDGLNLYGFKIDIQRDGHVFKLQTSRAISGDSFASSSLHTAHLTNVKIRSILARKINVI